jgi:RNA polymerase sigma factor (TIGR02999 family)
MPLVYDELRKLARRLFARERWEHTLQPTALVHEVFIRLVEQNRVDWRGRTHFYAIGARMMRRVLIDHARRRGRWKRGVDQARVTFEEALIPGLSTELSLAEVLSVHEALKELAELDARQARIVEQRYFGGLTAEEIAGDLGVSKRTVEAELTHARAWLRRRLAGPGPA